jgi:hypothetical protein
MDCVSATTCWLVGLDWTVGLQSPAMAKTTDGGATWTTFTSISCVTTKNCWAAGSGTTVALAGTANAGKSWATVKSDTSNQDGSVSCLSVSVCVATTDNGLWVTSDDGGLTPAG